MIRGFSNFSKFSFFCAISIYFAILIQDNLDKTLLKNFKYA